MGKSFVKVHYLFLIEGFARKESVSFRLRFRCSLVGVVAQWEFYYKENLSKHPIKARVLYFRHRPTFKFSHLRWLLFFIVQPYVTSNWWFDHQFISQSSVFYKPRESILLLFNQIKVKRKTTLKISKTIKMNPVVDDKMGRAFEIISFLKCHRHQFQQDFLYSIKQWKPFMWLVFIFHRK